MSNKHHNHMHVDVLFGSQSDERVFDKVLSVLVELDIHPTFNVCSAHRDPDRLRELIKSSRSDLFIAGAGFNAHLPGVTAAHTFKPVIGMPVNDALEGLDALLSVMQMPSGIPVLGCGVENYKSLKAFLGGYQQWRNKTEPTFSVFVPETATDLFNQFKAIVEPFPVTLNLNPPANQPSDMHIYFIDIFNIGSTPIRQENALCIPYTSEEGSWDPRILLELTQQGGMWFGLGNAKNAALAIIELMNHQGQHDEKLAVYRGGAPAHAKS